MSQTFKIYHAYTTCSRVTLTALEQVGVAYEDQLLDMMAGEHRRPDYLALNPQGKVPLLVVDGRPLTENGAIFRWLGKTFPDAHLFPRAGNSWEAAQHLADLFWLSSTWHPYVRANKAPMMLTTGDVEPVRDRGRDLFRGVIAQLNEKIQRQPWWYGDAWSIVDTYFWWSCVNAAVGGFTFDGLDAIPGYISRNEALPALQRALAREQLAYKKLQERKAAKALGA